MTDRIAEGVPGSPKVWAEEAVAAYEQACKLMSEVDGQSEGEVFKYAALFCCKNRSITDPQQRQCLIRLVNQNRALDFSQDPEARLSPTMNFLLAYFDANYSLGLLSEADLEQAMVYAIDKTDLFK